MRIAPIALAALLAMSAPALAVDVSMSQVYRGHPTDGVQTMDGAYAFVLRFQSVGEKITGFDFTTPIQNSSFQPGLFGGMAQRIEAPNHDGNYTLTTPGFREEANLTPSAWNFDTHFLGNPDDFIVTQPLDESNVGNTFNYWVQSDLDTGYGLGLFAENPYLRGAFMLKPEAQANIIEAAYIVDYGGTSVSVTVFTESGYQTIQAPIGPIPEPSDFGLISVVIAAVICRRA